MKLGRHLAEPAMCSALFVCVISATHQHGAISLETHEWAHLLDLHSFLSCCVRGRCKRLQC